MASEENNSGPNLTTEFRRLSRARNPEIQKLEAEMKSLLAEDEQLMRENEITKKEIDEIEHAINVEKAELAELSRTEVNLLDNSRKNKIRIDAYQHKLAPDTTGYERLQSEINQWKQINICSEEMKEKIQEKINLLNEKTMVQMDIKATKHHIESVLDMKCKEMHPNKPQ